MRSYLLQTLHLAPALSYERIPQRSSGRQRPPSPTAARRSWASAATLKRSGRDRFRATQRAHRQPGALSHHVWSIGHRCQTLEDACASMPSLHQEDCASRALAILMPADLNTCWQEGTCCRQAVARAGMTAATRAVGLTYIASLAGCVGSRRAGQQSALVSSRTACDTNRPTLLSPRASAVGRLKSHQVRLWTATAVAGQPSHSGTRPSPFRAGSRRNGQINLRTILDHNPE